MKIKNMRLVIGIVLIAVSVTLFMFWEVKGRDLVFREDLVVAKTEINSGDTFTRDNLAVVSIHDDDVIAGAVAGVDIEEFMGKTARQYIPQGAQLNTAFVAEKGELVIGGEESIFAIPGKIIDMVSSSLRRGDRVKVYGNSGKEELGEYVVAFVKDSSDREVKNLESLKNNEPVDREDSNYKIDSVEIICTTDDYAKIMDYVTVSEDGLTIVQVF